MGVRSRPRLAVFMDKIVFGALPSLAKEEVRNLRRIGIDASLLLIKRGIEVYDDEMRSIATDVLEDQSSILSKMGLKVPGFSFFSAFHLIAPLLAVKFEVPYDLLLTHGTYTCFTSYSLKKYRSIPYVAYIYDPISYILRHVYSDARLRHLFPILIPLGKKMDGLIVNGSEAVILLSRYHLNFIKEITNKPIHIVYPGTHAATKIPTERGGYLLAVARWENGKKPFFFIDLLKVLRREGIKARLLMVGSWKSPTLRTDFLRGIRENELQEQVTVCGPLERRDLSKTYAQARALIVPDVTAFGMIGLEAAAHGAPIVVPKGSGVTDLFAEGIHGFFPPEGDVEAYARSVKELVTDERRAWKMGHQAWKIAQNYTWESHARKLLTVLEGFG